MDLALQRMERLSHDTGPSPPGRMSVIQGHLHAHDDVPGFGVDPREGSVHEDIHRISP